MVLWKMGSLQDGWSDHYWTIHSDPILQACQGMSPIEKTSNIFLQQTKPEVGHPKRCLTKGILPKCCYWSFRYSSLGIIALICPFKHLAKQKFLKSAAMGKNSLTRNQSYLRNWGERCFWRLVSVSGAHRPDIIPFHLHLRCLESLLSSQSPPRKFSPRSWPPPVKSTTVALAFFCSTRLIGCEIRSKGLPLFSTGKFLEGHRIPWN